MRDKGKAEFLSAGNSSIKSLSDLPFLFPHVPRYFTRKCRHYGHINDGSVMKEEAEMMCHWQPVHRGREESICILFEIEI